MLYFVGGAPRAGKSILSQQLAATLRAGWVSTDLLMDLLRAHDAAGVKREWDAAPAAIAANAAWFFPYLERFAWGISSLVDEYVIEGVDFLPAQVAHLAAQHPLRAVFLGCSAMSLEHLTQYPGRSRGYEHLPEALRNRIVQDLPHWSAFIRREAERFGYPYFDTASDFAQGMVLASSHLLAK